MDEYKDINYEKLKNNIDALLYKRGYSARQMLIKLGLSANYLSGLKICQSDASLDKIYKIAQYLDVTVDTLIEKEYKMHKK